MRKINNQLSVGLGTLGIGYMSLKFEMTCPRSRMNRLNDVTESRISVRLGCKLTGFDEGSSYLLIYTFLAF